MTPTNVKNNIYIGDSDAAKDTETLNQKNINTVITLNTDLVADRAEMNKRKYQMYALLDSGKNPQEQVDAAVFQTAGEIESGNNFLIHCGAGMNRSPAILAAALALVEEKKFGEALNEIKERHEPTQLSTGISKQAEKSVNRYRNGVEE